MFIPYAVDASLDHRPVVNWLALGVIVLAFILQVVTSEKPEKVAGKPAEDIARLSTTEEATEKQATQKQTITGPMARFVLDGWGLGLFTYIWLHGGVAGGVVRFIGNLLFLWPFGNAVCSKIGNKVYLPVYIGFGLLAGVIHLLLGGHPAVGAAGAISAIIGMYIVLFPENIINCYFLLPHPVAASISGYWLIALWFIFDILEVGMSDLSVAYCAHILCLGAGFGLAVLMLKKKWVVMERGEKSLLQMLSREKEEEKEEDKKEDKQQEEKDVKVVDEQPEKNEPEKAAPKAEKTADDFIRFRCKCGHRIKFHRKDAGKTGRCPKCLRWVQAPRE